ncbi:MULTISPECIES: rhodanese-like domain-containing protein [unclassified Streptomyces]|uniref:rhodanese-like domain-containing protein n=1 Tax=unclassified Streptomyces TaxID=2593676 RepID=UPI002E171EF1
MGIDGLLTVARRSLIRLHPHEAQAAVAAGAVLVDTRPEYQRRSSGGIPGALIVERNHLEWRLDPTSSGAIPGVADDNTHWIVICDEGYSSSLAAASLRQIGLTRATDLIGGFQAWLKEGLPIEPP